MMLVYRVLQFLLISACAVAVILAQAVKSTPTKVSDPILGTWKLNVAKSKFSPVVQAGFKIAPIKERTETYREVDGSRIERTVTTTRTDGSVSDSKAIWPMQGGAVQDERGVSAGPSAISYFETLIGPGDWYVTGILDGKQVSTRHKIVSKDGRTTRQTLKGVTPDGMPFEQLEIYDRHVQAPQPSRPSFAVEVLPDRSLMSDGGGAYSDAAKGVFATGNVAIVICTDQRTCTTYPEREPSEPSQRALLLDLRTPVAASGAKDQGIVRATAANFGAFWGQDTTKRALINGVEGWVIRSVLDMEVGRTIESERIEIRFFMKGVQHVLQFGPWIAGQYQPNQSGLTGDGTTRGTITRESETRWLVRSAPESLGRLWDNRDPSHPVDLGLYRFSYMVQFARK